MDFKEMQTRSDKELKEMVMQMRERLRVLRFEAAADAVKNVREIRSARRDIARALTLLGERVKKGGQIENKV